MNIDNIAPEPPFLQVKESQLLSVFLHMSGALVLLWVFVSIPYSFLQYIHASLGLRSSDLDICVASATLSREYAQASCHGMNYRPQHHGTEYILASLQALGMKIKLPCGCHNASMHTHVFLLLYFCFQ